MVFKAKLNEERPAYRILGLCNPGLAKSVITAEAGTLLPCNLVVREVEDKTVFNFLDPEPLLALTQDDAI